MGSMSTQTNQAKPIELPATDTREQYRQKLARIALDEMYQFVALLDAKGTLLEVNRAALEGAGLKLSDVEGKPFWECFWWAVSTETQETLRKAILRAAQGEFIRYDVEVYGRAGGKETIIIDFSMIPVKDESGQVTFIVPEGRDITEKKAHEREIARKNIELAELDRAKTAFFSNVSHEFRTPLTLILGPVGDAITQANKSLSGENLDLVGRNALRLLKLVNALLDFSRIEAGRVDASYEATDLGAITAELASNFRSACERAGLRFVVDSPSLKETAYVDRDMWEKIVLNLVSNAFKYTLEGEIEVSLRAEQGSAVLTVRDSGIGISEEDLPKLFNRFHRIPGARGRTHEGTGIGLALVQELAKLHGGTVQVASTYGKGSRLSVTIPLGKGHLPADAIGSARALHSTAVGARPFVEEAMRWLPDNPGHDEEIFPTLEPLPSVAHQASVDRGPRARIVWADDNSDMRDYVRRLLEPNYDVIAVADGREALRAAIEQSADLVLTDVMMPNLDGFGLVQAIRADARTASIPVVMLSARAGEEARVEGLQAGADDYLIKPFTARELLTRVAATLSLARLRTDAHAAMQASEARYRSLTEATAQIIWTADGDGNFSTPSPSWEAFTGQRWGQYRDYGMLDAIHEEDRAAVAEAWAQSLASGGLIEISYRLRRADGVYRRVVGRGVPIRGADGRVREWVGTITDVEDQRRAEEQLRQAQQLQSVGTLAGGVAHEVNNQMTAVLGFGAFLLKALGPGHPHAADVRQMVRAGERAAQVTQQLLALSRRQVTQPERHDLHQLVADLIPVLRRVLGSDKTLVLAPDRATHVVRVDARQVEQVLINLAANARDAMGTDGRLTITLEDARLDAAYITGHGSIRVEPGPYVLMAVSDTGAGMNRDTLERAFEPFFTTKAVGEGTGLGLSMVYGVVKQHGGCVWIYSEPGLGTTVKVYLPAVATPVPSTPPSPAAILSPPGAAAVLLVEDDPLVRLMACRALEAAGHRVMEAGDGATAFDLATSKDGRPELLVTDLIMPRMNGRQLADALALHNPELPVIYMSGYTGYDARVRELLPPGAPFVQKPFTPDQLVDAVASLLHSARKTRPVG